MFSGCRRAREPKYKHFILYLICVYAMLLCSLVPLNLMWDAKMIRYCDLRSIIHFLLSPEREAIATNALSPKVPACRWRRRRPSRSPLRRSRRRGNRSLAPRSAGRVKNDGLCFGRARSYVELGRVRFVVVAKGVRCIGEAAWLIRGNGALFPCQRGRSWK